MKNDVASSTQNRQDATASDAASNPLHDAGSHLSWDEGRAHLADAAPFDGGFDTYDNTLPTGSTRAYVAGHWVPLATRPHVADVHALTVYGKDSQIVEPEDVTVVAPSSVSTFNAPKAVDVPHAELPSDMPTLQVQDAAVPHVELAMRENSNRSVEMQRPATTRAWSLEQRGTLDAILPTSMADARSAQTIETPPHVKTPPLPAAADLHVSGSHSMEYLSGTSVPNGDVKAEHGPPHLRGHAPGGAIVQILDGDESLGSAIADVDGNWTYPFDAPLAAGTYELMLRINGGPPSAPMRLFVEHETDAGSLHLHAEDHGTAPVDLLGHLMQPDFPLDFSGLAMRLAQAEATEPVERGLLVAGDMDGLRLDGLLAQAWAPVFDSAPLENDTLLPLDEVAVHEALSQPAALSVVDSFGDQHFYSDVVLPELDQPLHHNG